MPPAIAIADFTALNPVLAANNNWFVTTKYEVQKMPPPGTSGMMPQIMNTVTGQ